MTREPNPDQRDATLADPRRPEPLWSIEDIATYLRVDRRTIERLRASGKFPRPTVKIGRLPRWSPASVRRWVEGGGR